MGPYFSSAGMCGLAESGFELIRCVTIVTVLDRVSELLKSLCICGHPGHQRSNVARHDICSSAVSLSRFPIFPLFS